MTSRTDEQAVGGAPDEPEATQGGHRLRSWVAGVLVVLTSLTIAIATVTVWTHNTLFETDQFMDVVEPAIADPAFAAALSERVSEEVLVALDLEARVAGALDDLDAFLSAALIDALDPGERLQDVLDRIDRPSLAILAPSIAEDLEARIAARIDDIITSDAFQATVLTVVEETHRAAVALIQGDPAQYPNVYVDGGEVRINLLPVIRSVLGDVWSIVAGYLPDVTLPDALSQRVEEATDQLADALGAQLPDDFGQVTVMSEEDLNEIQAIGDRANRLVVLIVVATILLLVATIAVSPDRRRTIVYLAIGAVAAMVVTFLSIRAIQNAIVDRITDPKRRPHGRGAAGRSAQRPPELRHRDHRDRDRDRCGRLPRGSTQPGRTVRQPTGARRAFGHRTVDRGTSRCRAGDGIGARRDRPRARGIRMVVRPPGRVHPGRGPAVRGLGARRCRTADGGPRRTGAVRGIVLIRSEDLRLLRGTGLIRHDRVGNGVDAAVQNTGEAFRSTGDRCHPSGPSEAFATQSSASSTARRMVAPSHSSDSYRASAPMTRTAPAASSWLLTFSSA